MSDPLSGRTVRVGIGAVAIAAAVLSFSSLRDLAVLTGTPSHLAWLLPIAVDAAAAVSTVIWLRSHQDAVVVLARRLAWATIILSVTGNGVQHAYVAAGTRPPWGVAVAVGAVAPAILGAVIHLVVVARTDAVPQAEQDRPTVADQPPAPSWDGPPAVEVVPAEVPAVPSSPTVIPGWGDPVTDPDGFPVPHHPDEDVPAALVVPLQVSDGTGDRPTDDELVATVLAWGVPVPGIGTLAGRLSIGKTRAGRIKTMAEDGLVASQDDKQDATRAVGE